MHLYMYEQYVMPAAADFWGHEAAFDIAMTEKVISAEKVAARLRQCFATFSFGREDLSMGVMEHDWVCQTNGHYQRGRLRFRSRHKVRCSCSTEWIESMVVLTSTSRTHNVTESPILG